MRDNQRTDFLKSQGWTVIRFWNEDILRDIDGVCQHIVTVAGLTAADAARQVRENNSKPEEHHP